VGNRARIDVVEIKRTAQPVLILVTGRHQSHSGCVGKWVSVKFSVDMVVNGRAAAILDVGNSVASEPVWMCWKMGVIKFLIDIHYI
jgi:hypothetical protein